MSELDASTPPTCMRKRVRKVLSSFICVNCSFHHRRRRPQLLLCAPIYSFRVNRPLDVVAVITFLMTSLIVTSLVRGARKKAEAATHARHGLRSRHERRRGYRQPPGWNFNLAW